MRLLDARTGWDIFDITLLRPAGWMAEHARRVEGRSEVWVDFEELNARGWAEVIAEAPSPKIAEGSGRVVTATITHANDDVRTLTLSGGETLFVTGNHRMFSATAQDWVPVKDLSIGEELQTSRGRESVAALGYQHGRHQVYNLEVEAEHCYFVGTGEVLTHNTCPVKSNKELSSEAQAIHDTFGQPGEKAYDRKTVATGLVDNQPVYAISSNRTSPASEELASSMGYKRVYGAHLTGENQTHAEHILMNYADQQGAKDVTIAPSRPACKANRQDCAGRMATGRAKYVPPKKRR